MGGGEESGQRASHRGRACLPSFPSPKPPPIGTGGGDESGQRASDDGSLGSLALLPQSLPFSAYWRLAVGPARGCRAEPWGGEHVVPFWRCRRRRGGDPSVGRRTDAAYRSHYSPNLSHRNGRGRRERAAGVAPRQSLSPEFALPPTPSHQDGRGRREWAAGVRRRATTRHRRLARVPSSLPPACDRSLRRRGNPPCPHRGTTVSPPRSPPY